VTAAALAIPQRIRAARHSALLGVLLSVSDGYRLTVACPHGVVFEGWIAPQEADLDLMRLALRN
jgi:hypothetical protein